MNSTNNTVDNVKQPPNDVKQPPNVRYTMLQSNDSIASSLDTLSDDTSLQSNDSIASSLDTLSDDTSLQSSDSVDDSLDTLSNSITFSLDTLSDVPSDNDIWEYEIDAEQVIDTTRSVYDTTKSVYDLVDMSSMSLDQLSDVKQPTKAKDKRTLSMQFTAIEHQIMEMLAEGSNSPKKISTALGIPASTVTKFLARDDVRKYAQELIDARNTAIKAHLPTMLMGIIEAKLERIMEDPEASLADASKKDIVDIARVVNELIKTSDSATTAQDTKMDAFSAIYTQINNIQLNK